MSYYELLGVPADADEEMLQRTIAQHAAQWSKRATNAVSTESRHHAERQLQAIQEARQVLLKPDRRSAYDQALPGSGGPQDGEAGDAPVADNRIPCPFCREPIFYDARKCRWCNEWLEGRQDTPASSKAVVAESAPSPTAVPESEALRPRVDTGLGAFKVMGFGTMLVLMVVSLGLYALYWLWTRRDAFNGLVGGAKVGRAALVGYNVLLPLGWINSIASTNTEFAASDLSRGLSVFTLIGCVCFYVTVFQMRRVLNTSALAVGSHAKVSTLWTFVFNIFYLQHCINRGLASARL